MKARTRRRLIIAICSVFGIVALLCGSVFAYAEYRFHQMHRIAVPNLVATGPHAHAQTILMIGSTSRCALNGRQAAAFGSCAEGVTGVNSDVIMLLHVDPTTHRLSILSIPRDLVLQNVRPGQFHKVDAALADGPGQLVRVIEQDFGIPVNHFIELNFDSFQNVVNALGGIRMYFPYPVTDLDSGLNIPTAGCHVLNGFQSLAVVRARHLEYFVHGVEGYDGSGDLGRIIRDHEFLRVLAAAVAGRGLGNILTDNSLLASVAPQLTIDDSFSLRDMVSLLWNFHGVNPNTAPQTTMPNVEYFTDYVYEGYDYGSVVFPSYPQDQQAIDSFLGLATAPGSHVRPRSVTVSVVDAADALGAAGLAVSRLRAAGFKAVSAGSEVPVGPVAETLVYYSPGHLATAERVLASLRGVVSMAEGPTVAGAEVTVFTGTNFSVDLAAARSAGVGSHPASRGSTTPSSAGDGTPGPSPDLGPVSSAVQKQPFYDPRACQS